jgi:hypothetical protein
MKIHASWNVMCFRVTNIQHFDIYFACVSVKKVEQSSYRPGMARGFQEVKVPKFHNDGIGWWYGCQPYAQAAFTPRKYTWYSLLLEAESTPGS